MSVDDFQVLFKLGEGSYSKVFKVIRLSDQSDYAMKRVHLRQLNNHQKLNALNEVRILASIEHPNVISYKEAFFDDRQKCLFIVMEYAGDGDLKRRIEAHSQKGTLFQEDQIWNFIGQVAGGLKALHDRNIIHCDLKSANIFLAKDKYKLGDLNVSKVAKNGPIHIQTGTPYYASPQVWRNEPYDFKSDIWSLGVILYEMCSADLPFKGKGIDQLFQAVQQGQFQPISSQYSEDLHLMIKSCLSKDPGMRPSCDQILKHKLVKRFNEAVQQEKCNLLDTIRVQSFNRLSSGVLPKAKYDSEGGKEIATDFRNVWTDQQQTKKCARPVQHTQKSKKQTISRDSVLLPRSVNRESLGEQRVIRIKTSLPHPESREDKEVKGVNAYLRPLSRSPSPSPVGIALAKYQNLIKQKGVKASGSISPSHYSKQSISPNHYCKQPTSKLIFNPTKNRDRQKAADRERAELRLRQAQKQNIVLRRQNQVKYQPNQYEFRVNRGQTRVESPYRVERSPYRDVNPYREGIGISPYREGHRDGTSPYRIHREMGVYKPQKSPYRDFHREHVRQVSPRDDSTYRFKH